tara:strand:+ start:239 stop:436 length:198 start_codon:yes stop_codon:yes gene_type:complete
MRDKIIKYILRIEFDTETNEIVSVSEKIDDKDRKMSVFVNDDNIECPEEMSKILKLLDHEILGIT